MPKSRLKKKSLKSKLTWIFIALAIFLGGSVYAALQTGTGPLSFLSQTPDINAAKTKKCIEDPGCVDLIVQSAERGVKVTNVSNLTTTQAATQIKDNSKNIKLKTDEDEEFVKEVKRLAKPTPDKEVPVASILSTNLTPASSAKPESCAGGNGVKLTPGKYAATGYGWKDGKRSTESGTSQRECVLIDDDCGHSTVRACDEVYKAEPAKVILPVNSGPEYYAGKTPAQIREDERKNLTPPPKPKENCYDKSGVIMVTGSQLGGDRCVNGDWQPDKSKTCSSNQTYNPSTNICDTLLPAGNIPHLLTDAEIKAKQDECRGENKEYDTTKNDCGKPLKCGPGYTYRDNYCDRNASSESVREQIIASGEKFCADIDKNFDPSTGLCQSPTAGRPRECDPKKMYSQGTKEGYRFCEFDSSNKVISEKYVFCDSSTSTYDSKKGSCVSNKYPNAGKECDGSIASKDTSGNYTSTPSCGQSCGGLGSYPKDGKIYCNSPSTPTVSVRPDPTKITNQNGIVGAYANDPGECKYGNGAIKETNGKYACPTDTLANPVLDSIPTPITPPENNPTVQAKLDKMANDIKASGKCTDSIIDVGIRIVCDPDTKEPTFDFCDGGNGRFDNNGKCIPVLANDDSLNAPSLVKSAGVGALWGAGAGALFCVGSGIWTGPLAVALIPACLASIGTATTLVGGTIGFGVGIANTPTTPATP